DLSKWKSRRRSVNSDIVKKKEEREKIEQLTFGSSRRSKTFKEMEEDREIRRQSSVGSRLGSLCFDEDEDVFAVPSPRTRAPPTRSFTTDAPFHPDPLEPCQERDNPPAASPADVVVSRTSSNTIAPASRSSPSAAPAVRSPVHTSTSKTTEETTTTVSSRTSVQELPEPRRPLSGTQPEAPSSGSLSKQQPHQISMEPKPPGVSRVSASLPRSYQRPDPSARLTSVVTPRPFGTQPSRITSLPRTFTTDNTSKRVNGDVDVSKNSSVPSRYQQFMTSEDEDHSQSSSAHSSEDEEEQEETAGKSVTSSTTTTTTTTHTQSISPAPLLAKSEAPLIPAPVNDTSQKSCCEMRISLNQKPNSSRDFGFQAAWDSTGAHVTSIQPGSPAEMFQLQPGDEVLTVNGHQVAEMSYTDWKAGMEEALQGGCLVMDIRRHGKNNWDRDQPSPPFKSHKTINLTSVGHPILVGFPAAHTVNSSLDLTSHISRETQLSAKAPTHAVIDVASNGVNGGFRDESVTMRNKEPISLKNLKRRSEFFEQGCSESSVSALVYLCGSETSVPDVNTCTPITPSSSRWSWDPEEERRRQEKWQKEQERLLQEKYKRDQEKLQEEWLKAQEEITKNVDQQEPGNLEVNNHSMNPLSPLSPISQSTPPPWEEEERKRREQQENQRQEEERRKREEEERELQRLQEERKRRERQEDERRKREEEERERQQLLEEKNRQRQEEERKRQEEEELRWQKRREEEREEERRRQEAAEQQFRERQRALEQQQWTAGSHTFASSELSFADRAKSKSSPQLDEEEEKPQRRGVYVQWGGMAHWLLEDQLRSTHDKQAQSEKAASELEMERRNILSAMRYREPERVTGGGVADRKSLQPLTQAELERQQILNEMKKKNSLLTDNSWIRQRSTSSVTNKEADMPPMRRGESLDNLDAYNSCRSSWTQRNNSHMQNDSRPQSALAGSYSFYGGGSGPRPSSATLPSSSSMGSLRGRAGTPSSPWSHQSPSSLSSVSGKKICTFCDTPLGKGAAMIIESLGLCYHLGCFKCIDCKSDLGGSEAGAEVRIRNKQLYCNSCYMRFKTGQPTAM
ncbi:LIM domain only protein 7-like, partial [Lampetra planeri]